jgi:dihydroorotate dehydrogenase (NAD+) catalytic subunit
MGLKDMKVKLAVNIGKLKLKNPVMVASGTFGLEYGELININRLGAIVLKTITLEERHGNPAPRVAETDCGMLNSIGLENKGLEYFIKYKIAELKKVKVPVIASIAGTNEREYASLAAKLGKTGAIDAIEVNLSCPNVKHGAHEGLIAQDAEATYSMVRAVRKVTGLTLIAKLTPSAADIVKIAASAEKAGADAILAVNTFPAMAADIVTRKPRLGNITGGLSGPAIKPIALKMVWDLYNNINIPVIGCGGIIKYDDAIEFMLCGAAAIQVGTALFANPRTPLEIIDGVNRYCVQNKIGDINKLTGGLRVGAL